MAVPALDKFPAIEDNRIPSEVIYGDGNLILNCGRKAVILKVVNIGDRPVQVINALYHNLYSYLPTTLNRTIEH